MAAEQTECVRLPQPIVEALRDIYDKVPDDVILNWVADKPELRRGYKATAANIAVFRQSLKQAVAADYDLGCGMPVTMIDFDLGLNLISMLSFDVLRDYLNEFMEIYGPARFLANLLVDSRLEVRRMAAQRIQQPHWDWTNVSSAAEAGNALREAFSGLFGQMMTWPLPEALLAEKCGEEVWGMGPAPGNAVERQALVKEQELRQKQKERFEARIRELEKELAEFKERLERATRRIKESEFTAGKQADEKDAALNRAQAEIERLKRERDESVRRGVEAALAETRNRWLANAEALAREAENPARIERERDLLQRAEAALQRQAAHDRQYHTRTELQNRLDRLERALARIQAAAADALNPLGELQPLEKDLQREIAQIQGLLNRPRDSEILRGLRALIGQAGGEQLGQIREFIETANRLSVLRGDDIQILDAQLHERMQRVYDAGPQVQVLRPTVKDPLAFFKWARANNSPSAWLIDGHNFLHCSSLLAAFNNEKGEPGLRAREELPRLVGRLFAGTTECRAIVFYDGSDRKELAPCAGVRVLYSGGVGDHRADRAILDWITETRRGGSDLPVFVITDDFELARQAHTQGVTQMRIVEFERLLRPLVGG